MSDTRTFVVVGGGLAGARAVESLRHRGFEGRIVLLCAEADRPYERPLLSKEFLQGKKPAEKAYVHGVHFYAEQDIELRLGARVTAVDRAAREVAVDGGERVHYDALLLATGAAPVQLKIPGATLSGVHYLRTMSDSESLRSALQTGEPVVIVGGGWIGLEVAAAARGYGAPTTIVEPQSAPLLGVLGPELGAFYAAVHRDHGVDLRLGLGVTEFRGDGAVDSVVTSDGAALPASVVVVGVGARPEVALAVEAGLTVDDGVVVDANLRTSDPAIYAAGDIANAFNPHYGRHVRVLHWANANDQGPVAAASMLGADEPFTKVPYFYSDQYDVGMECSGIGALGDQVVFRGDVDKREFCAFWLHNHTVAAGMNVNVWDVHPDIRGLIKSRARVDVARLTDVDVPIAEAAVTE